MRFLLGSMTEHITALALLRALDHNGLGVDTPVRNVLPDFRLRNDMAERPVTFGHMMSHSTGLEAGSGLWSDILALGVSHVSPYARPVGSCLPRSTITLRISRVPTDQEISSHTLT